MTIAGSGDGGHDGDEKPALEARLNNPSGVAAASMATSTLPTR